MKHFEQLERILTPSIQRIFTSGSNYTRSVLLRFLLLFLPSALLCISAVVLVFNHEVESDLEKIRSSETTTVDLGVGAGVSSITRELEIITQEVSYLATNNRLNELVESWNPQQYDNLVVEWIFFSSIKRDYDQIRWIDQTGQERIRINFNNREPTEVLTDQLQYKGNRYYFTDTIKLNQGEFFISPLDLNIEHGEIEMPLKPMIRIGTPIFNRAGNRQGILIVNYLAGSLLQEFDKVMGAAKSRSWLVNREGYWLKGPSTDLEWGFMFQRPEVTVAHKYPEVWREVLSDKRGQFEDEHGLWTYSTVYPLIEGQKTSSGTHAAFAPSRSELESREYFWKVILLYPRTEYYVLMRKQGFMMFAMAAAFMVVLLLGSWRLAVSKTLHIKAEQEIRQANRNLEQTVQDRTAELSKSEKRWQFALEGNQDGVWDWDVVNHEVLFTKRWKEMLGYEEDEIANKLDEWEKRIHPNDKEQVFVDVNRHFDGETAFYENEHRVLCKDGSYKWILDRGKVVSWTDDHRPQRMISTHSDITERKQAEKELETLLHDKGERVKELQCMYGVVESIRRRTDLEDIFKDIVELIPPGWHYPEITRGKIIFDGKEYVSAPFEATEWKQSCDIMVNGEPRGSIEVYYLEECPELDEGPFMKEERNLINGMAKNISDAIEHRLSEVQLRRSQKMELVGQLAGGVAHDFNNLLGIIQSNFEILQDYDVKDDDYQQWINTGLKTVKRGSSLTRRLLSFSRSDTVGSTIININESIVDLKELLAKSLTPQIKVELKLTKDVWYVDINTDEFQDALVNLAINARDAMPEGGTLQIATSNREFDENDIKFYPGLEAGSYVCMSIGDTGCGMDAETLERVFEPFYTTKEKGKGTGLGVSMVYGFAKRSQGYVKFYSEVGHGTTVRLYLPMVDRREKERDECNKIEKIIPGGSEVILAVDDEPDILKGLQHRLESLGYQVLTAGNGQEALDIINNHQGQIALLFSDVVMPGGMSGYELAEEVRKKELDIKILLASGFTDNIPKKTDSSIAYFEIMEKPYTKMALASRVRKILDND